VSGRHTRIALQHIAAHRPAQRRLAIIAADIAERPERAERPLPTRRQASVPPRRLTAAETIIAGLITILVGKGEAQ
jgi:hypothetical protein